MLRFLNTTLLIAFALVWAGCGGSDRTFDESEFVDALNEEGAEVSLGSSLSNDQDGVEVFEIRFEDHATENAEAPAAGEVPADDHEHGGGSLAITEDDEAGVEEYQRCEGAVTLLCFRAGNAVLILEDSIAPEDAAALETAIRGLESD